MAKTIADYKADYEAAKAAGDAAGMQAANDGANAIRKANNEAPQYANVDIAAVAKKSQSSNKQTTSAGSSAPSTGSSQTSASTNANKQTSAPAGYAGSSTSVGVHTTDQEAIKAQMNANSQAWYNAPSGDVNTKGTKEWYHAENERLAAQLGGSVGYDEVTGSWSGVADKPQEELPQQQVTAPQMPTVDPNAAQGLKDYLDAWLEAAKTQSGLQIDYATQKGVTDLERAEEDAAVQFQTQRDQVSRDERVALDNSALYSEARGDRGGIGEAQYDLIMANAAKNRLAVNQAQTKLSTDTQRQMTDLRAQGEFQKADQLLQLTQTYLSQLMQLEQWGLEYALSATQFNAQMQQWMANFELSVGELMGSYQGMPTLGAQKADESKLAAAGETLLAAGIMPSRSQLAAMGMTSAQAQDYITAAKLAAAAKGSSGGGNGGTTTDYSTGGDREKWYAVEDWLKKNAPDPETDPEGYEKALSAYLGREYANLGFKTKTAARDAWDTYDLEEQTRTTEYLNRMRQIASDFLRRYDPYWEDGRKKTWSDVKRDLAVAGISQEDYEGVYNYVKNSLGL